MKIFSISLIFFSCYLYAREPITGNRFEHLSGQKLRQNTQKFWNKKYQNTKFIYGKSPVKFLEENAETLNPKSKVLDMGMAEGRNAVFLARKGHEVTGVDISSVAVKKANLLAKEFGVHVNGVVASLEKYKTRDQSFDAILSLYYFDKKLIPQIKKWLKPGGLFIIESYTNKEKKQMNETQITENTFVSSQELLELFKGFKVIKYTEPLKGEHFTASAIFQKPTN